MDAIVSQIYNLAEATDDGGRLLITTALRQVEDNIQSPKHIIRELVAASMTNSMLRVGLNLGLFTLLSKSDTPLGVDGIAAATGASPQLLERILRYLAARNIIKETRVNEYTTVRITHVLSDPEGKAMIDLGFNTHGPVIEAMPDFLAENNYQDITDIRNTPLQKAHNTKLTSFEWFVQNEEHFENLQRVMTSLQGAQWTQDLTIFNDEVQKIPCNAPQGSEKPFFVDVGGGHGHQCRELGKKYPNLLGRLVLQDLPEGVGSLAPIEGVKVEAYDFFQPQTITGAKFYYFRRVMHDWPDKEATVILQNTAVAMGPDSRILIDEVVLPETGASWLSTLADLAMMAFGGKERTLAQWNSLARSAGLRVEHVHSYFAPTDTALVVLARE